MERDHTGVRERVGKVMVQAQRHMRGLDGHAVQVDVGVRWVGICIG